MAVNDHTREDAQRDPPRDPQLARLLAAASREEPPAALDAAILAAARREVQARPQVVGQTAGGGGGTSMPPVRAKRNWYVPMSIAAVMVLSVSMVLTMHHEKGDELSQPPKSAPAPAVAKSPAPAAVSPAAPAAADAMAEKADTALKDAVSAKPKLVEEKRAETAAVGGASGTATTVDGYTELAKKPRAEKPATVTGTTADGAAALGGLASARKDQAANVAREQGPAPEAAMARNLPGAVPAPTTAAPAPARVPEAFPAMREREAAPPVTASRDVAESRARMEADRDMRRAAPDAPMVSATPPPPPAPAPIIAPRRAAPTDDTQARQAPQAAGRSGSATLGARGFSRDTITDAAPAPAAEPARAEDRTSVTGSVAASPPLAPQAKPAPPPPAKKAAVMQQRLPVWRGLEDQPPEKWLERLAEFKRDNRQTDADELLAEFRRRFPDHPAGTR